MIGVPFPSAEPSPLLEVGGVFPLTAGSKATLLLPHMGGKTRLFVQPPCPQGALCNETVDDCKRPRVDAGAKRRKYVADSNDYSDYLSRRPCVFSSFSAKKNRLFRPVYKDLSAVPSEAEKAEGNTSRGVYPLGLHREKKFAIPPRG
jgi:hypothetical protein